ncbi:uroporphyrinogen-III synthase [Acidithiobacillus sp. CV18-2]|uniref:Uroporphyrinogen-III synthase n=1 Tax=Igneacidithiobacillus copahuensis TaxID=2724909 RepID=A0AAE2YS92_9PROT|nr:uroporphyrinogen-III synthase [Igneacidithiobacillus copahuensis]MBU2755130.1 uroporphyrinogen-III synthase [Acidithiobacillus sp. CV18-3]MBU2758100.1 uroporphyrinogen-III synthase [Acidithiobacillus sp. BN09-2]MBU2777722.1 uroporphyrinogen-III synthase [Acidithiobacillus sp. CV18-2]MBU2797036.1 uroporphyrinogen-III synthase [Acidithiobacillus sp. VAN18-2]MBU2798364.1 uroporphyrinogen-III synthase [Acidithiobacillus sp. VAN18-4]UTV80724.1 uroporphyrinogen-III synthase [Acidithiobacillus sp
MSVILQNKGIVVTRPKEQSAELIAELQRLGARAIAFPALQIDAPETWHSLDAALDQLDSFDWAVFTSRNAVHFALSRWQSRGQHTWPASVRVAAVGRESAKAIAEFGIEVALAPKRAGSEGLLENPEWQTVAGQRFALFAGDQGRELIQQTLEERGAMVEKIFCYRRVVPGANPTPLLHAWARGELDAVTVTSPEIFHNFYQMVGGLGQRWLKKTPIIAISPLTAEAITSKGLPAPWVAPEASNAGLIAALEDWARQQEKSA